jgi:hypothetical protein
VTKEKFLRAITEDSPLLVEQEENDKLEQTLLEAKVELRQIKDDVEQLLVKLEALGKKLAEGLLFLTPARGDGIVFAYDDWGR